MPEAYTRRQVAARVATTLAGHALPQSSLDVFDVLRDGEEERRFRAG